MTEATLEVRDLPVSFGDARVLHNVTFTLSVVRNPTLSLEGDVYATQRVIDAQAGAVILP